MPATKKSILAGIFCLGLSVIVFEIALTRVFAIMMWHHFTYMVISIGLLGFGASGSLLTATRLGDRGEVDRMLVRTSLAYGVAVWLAFAAATLVPINSLEIWREKKNAIALLAIYLIIFVPFLLGGLGIGLALTRYVAHVNRLYFADLVGSALGAAASVLAMKYFGSTATVVFAGAIGLVAAFCFGGFGQRRVTILGLVLALGVSLGFASGKLDWKVPFAPNKEAAIAEAVLREMAAKGLLGGQSPELAKLYSATAEVQVGPSVVGGAMIGGDQGRHAPAIEGRAVGQDGTAPTMLYKGAARIGDFPFLTDTQAASAYVVHRASGHSVGDVMVIGVGGGVDVMVALVNGASHVTAVELNTAMIDMVTAKYDDYLGGLFRKGAHALADRIELVNSEGRSWLRSHDAKYDCIQMSGVDSYTALSTGAYTLSESYLYTTGAVHDFWEHLNPEGTVTWSRFIESAPNKSRETLRLANIACSALRELGVADPAAHLCVFQGHTWASTMVKKAPFTAVEIQALRTFARAQGFVGLVFDPLRAVQGQVTLEPSWFAESLPALQKGIAALPGFAGDAAQVQALADQLLDLAINVGYGERLAPAMLPEPLRGPEIGPKAMQLLESMRPVWTEQAAYMRTTIGDFAKLLRGDDAERARFLADYQFDVSPATDDAPFFFNWFRWSSLLGGSQRTSGDTSAYHTDFPIGHAVLLLSLAQILVLAAVFIFWPLRKFAREGLRTPGAWRYFGYFAALGLGFMLIEIALMQKLVIFLGHPTYALSVVLASLLASAGTGSLLAGRIATVTKRHLRLILLGIVAMVALDVAAVNWLLPLLLGVPLSLRIAVVIAMLVPTGLVLGMPFPSGMRVMQAQCPHLVPWGWAVNAFFSVFGSIFCIVLSMGIGFSNVFFVAIAVYALGLLGMKAPLAPPQRA
jgi:hypothetical protein